MSILGLISAVGAAVTWGAVYTLDQQILKGASPIGLLLVNAILTAVIATPLLLSATIRQAIVSVRFAGTFVVVSLLLAALANFLIFTAIKHLGASTASVFEIAYPIFVVAFSAFFLRSRPTLPFLIGTLFVFVGAAIIV